jgi:excisionase family DNA binding protein
MKKQVAVAEAVTGEARLYEPRAFARVISWHPESVRRAIRQGRIKAVRLGGGWRIPADEVSRICSAGLPSASAN